MEYPSILYKKEAAIATILLNRPKALNALNASMIEELRASIKRTAEDPQIRVLILSATGRAFCFGADISEFTQPMDSPDKNHPSRLLSDAQEIIRLLTGMPKPTLAAINGFATGLGLDLCLACDLRIAAERAKLGEAFVSMGLVPDGGGTFFLPRLVGLARAAEMIFLGKPLTASEAFQIGLINRVVPTQELEPSAREIAEQLAKGPSLAIGLAKRVLWKNLSVNLETALQEEARSQNLCLASDDHREAVQAFLQKRDPVFRGK